MGLHGPGLILPRGVVAVPPRRFHAEGLPIVDEDEGAQQDGRDQDADDDEDVFQAHISDPGGQDEDEDCCDDVARECDTYQRVAHNLGKR